MLDYFLVCPSYNRPHIFKNKTYSFLQLTNAPLDKLIVFVASEEQKELYQQLDLSLNIVVGVKDIAKQRNFIQNYYPLGSKILSIDDDIKFIWKKDDTYKSGKKVIEDFNQLVELGFQSVEDVGASIWGVYPLHNAYFMKDRIYTKLSYIIGAFYGFINKRIYCPEEYPSAEDLWRSLYYFKTEGKLCRLDNYGLETKYYNPIGGLSDIRTVEKNNADKSAIQQMFPDLCTIYYKKDKIELRLKRTK